MSPVRREGWRLAAVRRYRLAAALAVLSVSMTGLLSSCSPGRGPTPPPPPDDPPPEVLGLGARGGALRDTLVWSRTEIADFLAYRVRRTARGALPGSVADTTTVEVAILSGASDTLWIDPTVSPGHRYSYSVEIEDRAGQRGPRSTVDVQTGVPSRVAIGFEPRVCHLLPGGEAAVTLWVAGVEDLQGVVVTLRHGASRTECRVGTPFGDPTLSLCTGPTEGPTDLAITGVRGGPTLSGVHALADLRFAPAPASRDSVTIQVRSLARPDGSEVEGGDEALILSTRWEPAP